MSDPPINSPGVQEQQQVTRLLNEAHAGGSFAAKELFPLIYQQLRELAGRRMATERREHTLSATALVHEAYVKLVGSEPVPWASRRHFFFAAAEAMRRILVDHARARGGAKRGGGRRRVPMGNVLDLARVEDEDVAEILSLDEALSRFDEVSPDAAAVVRVRFFAGLSEEEAASALGCSSRTVRREWTYARAWLARELGRDRE